jgi:RNA polymerase sigma-32 factor
LAIRKKNGLSPRERPSPLQLYFREVAKYPLLSPEEEYDLAVKHFDEADVDAAHRLVTSNLRLVVKIANELGRARTALLDLIQEGNAGLMQAVKKFNPYKGVRLSTYAAWWIKAYIIKYIMDNHSQIRLATTAAQRKLYFNLRKETERLLKEYDEVTPKLLASSLDVSEEDVVEMQGRLGSRMVSLDAPTDGRAGGMSNAEIISTDEESTEDRMVREQIAAVFSDHIEEFTKTLNERDAQIFTDRMLSETPATLQEIADRYGVSRERARQLEQKIVNNLRKFVEAKGIIDIS